jgi:signal transduction histidine kinase
LFSHQIVVALENEKRHLSSILHHDAGSLAVGISAYLDAMEEDLRSGQPGKALRWLRRTRNLFDKSLKRLKGLAVELRPPELDVLGLGAALRQHFALVTKRGGVRIRFREGPHGNRLSGDTAIVLFRVAQEALTNAIKHGLARRVAVDLVTLKTEVRLTIRDNGRGFDPSEKMKLPMSHLGLRVMREMADFAAGVFTIASSPGKGATVRLALPIKTAPAPAPVPPSPGRGRTRRRGKGPEVTRQSGRAGRVPTHRGPPHDGSGTLIAVPMPDGGQRSARPAYPPSVTDALPRERNIRSAVRSPRPQKGGRA